MANRSTKGVQAVTGVLDNTKPTGKQTTGKPRAQDIELNPKSTPAVGKAAVVDPAEQISKLLTASGGLKKGVTPEDVIQVIARWNVSEGTTLEMFGANGKAVLKYLQKNNPELFIDALHKVTDPDSLPRKLNEAYKAEVAGQTPNVKRPKVNDETVTARAEKRTNRNYEKTTGNMDPNQPAAEKLETIGLRMDAGKAEADDYLYALGQGVGDKKFTAELERIQSMTDPAERQEAISNLAANATAGMGRGDDLSFTSKFEQFLDQHLGKIDTPKTSGGAKVGEGSLPEEKQQSLDFDGGGDAKSEGPEIDLGGKENSDTFEQKPEASPDSSTANSNPFNRQRTTGETAWERPYGPEGKAAPEGTKAPEQTPEASQGGGGKDTPPPDAKTATGAPGEKPNNSRKVPPPGPDSPQHYAPRQPVPEEPNPILLRGEDGLGSSPLTKDEWEARVGKQDEPFRAAELKAKRNQQAGMAAGAAAGTIGSIAWAWLAGGDDEPEVQPSALSASITGGPSTATGSSGGVVADGSGGSSGGMSQEQMENLMKLQQIRDEQKRRFIGTGSGAQGVYR